MSHAITFEELFGIFKKRFPPTEEDVLKFTTPEFLGIFENFAPNVKIPDDFVSFLRNEGYQYKPVEYNEEIRFYWLVGSQE